MKESRQIIGVVFSLGFEETHFLLLQGCPTCGPRKGFEWPAGLFRNYQYYQLNCYVIYCELSFREMSFNVCFLVS